MLLAAAATIGGAAAARRAGSATTRSRGEPPRSRSAAAVCCCGSPRGGFTAPTFGAANAVTLARAVLVLLLLACLGVAATGALGWMLVALSVVAAALDGFDGALARGRGEASEFGARFDMETDALLILVLAALVWQHGKAGVWILLAGLLRYLFVAASYV